ncbi:MAG: IucA/IucC family siderophore biosynthesis protein [Pseudomonadota bacterium]|nr:IucA/IucC family siderophore biosynthesis protein [Pseudomonadota bacterium]
MPTIHPPLSYLQHYAAAQARTVRQFVEAFWNEGYLKGTIEADAQQLRLRGLDEKGQPRNYRIDIAQQSGFDRLRLTGTLRGYGSGDDLASVVSALVRHLQPAPSALRQFIRELQHTALNHAWAMTAVPRATLTSDYPWQEAQLGDGHPYHPCFRSRIGFSVQDNLRFGPEFAQPFELVWLAIATDASDVHAGDHVDYDGFLAAQLGVEEYCRLRRRIEVQRHTQAKYRLMPVHPWQWEHATALHFSDWLADGTLLYLGTGSDKWLAQQSIRSLSSLVDDRRYNIKLPLAIANSSADRILSDHHVHNAPIISRWLEDVCGADDFLNAGRRLAILPEPVGITVAASHQRGAAYGMLGAIWRQSPQSVLQADEQIFPMTALTTLNVEGALTITPWLDQHGVERWVTALLEACAPPLLHMLMAHGVLLECHAQNTLLILSDGLPQRIAIRDLPGGMHYLRGATGEAQLAGLRAAPSYRNAINASAGFLCASQTEARDYLLEVLFFINLGELAWCLQQHHGYAETLFWRQAAYTIAGYQARFPEMAQRHAQFDLLGARLQIECLAARRLLGWSSQQLRTVRSPLHGAAHGIGMEAAVAFDDARSAQ